MGKWFQNKSFSTEKREQGIKARKGHRGINARKIHRDIKARKASRAFGILLAAALVFQTVPFEGIAVSASESSGGGLCEHHRSHTPDCGYKEAEEGHGCTHEHMEDCYRTVEGEDGSATKEPDCHHEHDESCGYREAAEGSPCTFVCEICRGGTDEIPEDKTDGNEIKDGDSENPGTENGDVVKEPDDGQEECICEERCTEDNGNGGCRINTDCPVCGVEDASLSDCRGKDTEDSTEDAEENTDQQEDTGLCRHHQEHDDACGYLPESEDSEGSPCTYECRICPVEELIAALPDVADITEENAEEVRAQLEEILALYRKLTEDEQEQIDLSRVYKLQGALDNANAPIPLVNGDVTLTTGNKEVIFTVGECGDNCQGHIITQNVQGGAVEAAKILVESGTHDITFSGLNLSSAVVGIMPGGTMNLTLDGNNTITANNNLAGIYVPVSATLVITEESTGSLTVSGSDSAGIGGAWYAPTGERGNFDCGTVIINGGTIAATGSGVCAGIGGAYDDDNQTGGNGGTVTINGGTVTATGGVSNVFGGAGIGGGGATMSREDSGCGGTLTINGGHVILTAPCSNAYGFGKGYGRNPSGTCSLTLADESYLTLTDGTNLDPNGTYAINGDPTEDMIVVPELVYTGEILDTSEIRIDDSKTGTATYFGQTFQVKASADGWVLQDLGEVREAKEYTATFKKDDKEISKKFTVAQSGTEFTGDGTVKTYKDGTECSDFTADDTITVKATPTATGQAPTKAAARLRSAPTNGQMAVFVGDNQVSGAVNADADGSYTMEIKAGDVLRMGNVEPNGGPVTLTARFVGNDNMADGEGTVTVNITAAAKIERDKQIIGYVGESGLDAAFAKNGGNSGATITLLKDVERTEYLSIDINCILDLGGHTITCTGGTVATYGNTNVTIQGAGEVVSASGTALDVGGNVTLKGGTFTSGGLQSASVNVNDGSGSLSVTENVTIQNTGGGYGLAVSNAQSVQLSGGKYSGTAGAIVITSQSSPLTLGGLLGHSGDTRYAYFDESGTNPFTGVLSNKSLTGTVTVRECQHTGEGVCAYVHNENATTHQQTCLACGLAEAAADCAYSDDYGHDETNHWQTCTLCGGKKTEAHNWVHQCTSATGIIRRSCDKCEIETVVGTVSITPDFSVAYGKTGSATLVCTAELADGYSLEPADSADNCWVLTALSDGKSWNLGRELEVKLPADLPAGEYWYNASPRLSYQGDNTIVKRFNVVGKVTVTPASLTIKANDQAITYGGSIAQGTGQTTVTGLCTGDILSGITLTASTGEVSGGDITPSAAQIKNGSNEDVTANYDIVYETGKLTISYMDSPAVILYNGEAAKGWYNGDVVITADGYTVSDTLGRDYKDSYIISAQEGTVTKTLYFKDAAGHMSGGVEVMVKFDLTPPTGEIAVGAKWWQNVLHFISFGNYAAKEYTVTIKAEDKKGSGISKIAYAIVTGSSQYTDADTLKAANLSWKEYNSGSQPTVPVSNSQYVVYARLTDNVGNVTYISTDGILLDNTPPTVGSLSVPEDTRKDVTAGFTFTVSEAADYYYVVLPKDSAAPDPEDIIVTCGGTLPEGTGTAISGTFPKGSGAVSADTLPASVSVEAENLSPNTAYTVYVTTVDRAVDISNSASGTPAGNIGNVAQIDFTTKKTLPVITKNPAISGIYGQALGEMTMTDGAAADNKGTAVTGAWEVSSADRNKKPSAGTAEKVTVIFTPDRDSFDSVSVEITPAVGRRNLNAEGVTVSEVAGTYTYTGSEIKPPVAVDTGTPAAGIYISDSGAALTASDFTVSYSNHKDAGTASVTITGKGNYTGSVTRTFTIGKASGREVPDVSGGYADNGQTYTYTVTPTEGAVYRMGNDGKWQEENAFEGITPGTSVTFYAMMPEDKNHEEGTPKYITVDFPKLTPAAPALTYKADRTNPADVKVTITPVSGAQYSFDGGQTWTESNEQGGFTASDTVSLAVRLKETATHNQSPEQTLTIDLAKGDREAPPAFTLSVEANGETDYTVIIPATEGCEYSFDGKTWSDVNVRTGVQPGETVTGYKRYKETDDYNAGSAVSASKTMEKFTVKTPVISPAGGSYTGSVSVAITCASPGAEIYYTTDGSTPGRGSTRYTGAFTVTTPATVKAIAVKDGLTDSAVVTASYTKKSSGGSGSGGNGGTGGNSGGNEDNGTTGENGGTEPGNGDNGGQDSGSTSPGNGTTAPQISVNPSAGTDIASGNGAAPGTGITPANSGNGNAVRPGTSRSSGAGTSAQGAKQPFIKGEDGKIGWDVIRAEEEKAQEGSTINVDMNGSTVVPGDIFDRLKGKDITITFDMGNGIFWSVDGKSITGDASLDKAGDIDFSIQTGVNTVPVDIVNNVTGESYSIQISLAYEGEFGFTAVLSIGLGKENAGYTASLYYYNESTGELEFICADKVAQDGTVSLAFTHASDYVIAIDGDEEEGDDAVESVQPENTDQAAGSGTEQDGDGIPGNPSAGQTGGAWRIIVIFLLAAAIGAGVFVAVKKKDEKGRQ